LAACLVIFIIFGFCHPPKHALNLSFRRFVAPTFKYW
jgi:hypothetical protein